MRRDMVETFEYIFGIAALGLELAGVSWWWVVALAALLVGVVLLMWPDE